MSLKKWSAIDQYICDALVHQDEALRYAQAASARAGLPTISVSAAQGKLLHLLAQMQSSKAILEIGTLGGYSTLWLARALLPGGKVVTLELDPKHASVARETFQYAGLSKTIDLRVGPALKTLPKLVAEKRRPFDFVFIDADKNNIPHYFKWALKLTRPGSVIVVDNVVRRGRLIETKSTDANVKGVRQLHRMLAKEKRVSATTIQTVGSKGYDGFALIRVLK